MANRYKVKITSHGPDIGNFKNMVTKYREEKSQSFMDSIKDIMSNLKRKKKKKTVGGGKKSKHNKRRKSRSRKKRTRRRRRKKR